MSNAIKKSTPLCEAENEYLKLVFMKNVNKNTSIRPYELTEDCWDWTGHTEASGRGVFQTDLSKKLGILKAHRLSMYFFKNEEYMKNELLFVLHACDRGQCVNPGHLRMDTQKENVQDRVERGRSADVNGSANPNAKFNDDQIKEIIELRKQSKTYPEIATIYGCSKRTIEKICLGKKGYSDEVVVVNARQRKFEEIRELLRQGIHTRVIAERLHTSSATIVKIRKEMP